MITFAIIGAVAAGCCILAFIWGIARWVGKLEDNTKATQRLTQIFEHFVERVGDALSDHGTRITRLETRFEYLEDGSLKKSTHTKIEQVEAVEDPS